MSSLNPLLSSSPLTTSQMSYTTSSLNPLLSAALSAVHDVTKDDYSLIEKPTSRNSIKLPASHAKVASEVKESNNLLDCNISKDLLVSKRHGRRPQMGRKVLPNALRPLVPARERLYFWRTPYGENHLKELHKSLPIPLAHATCLTVRSALKPNSVSTYAAGLLRFTQLCDKWQIPECERMASILCSSMRLHFGSCR